MRTIAGFLLWQTVQAVLFCGRLLKTRSTMLTRNGIMAAVYHEPAQRVMMHIISRNNRPFFP